MAFVVKTIDTSIEDKIVIGCVVSDKFLKELVPLLDLNYLKSPNARLICEWALDYYSCYGKAPKQHIQDIFDLEKHNISPDNADILSTTLSKLSKEYEKQGINDDLFIDRAVTYFKQRELEIVSSNVQKYISLGRVEEAEDQLTKYKKVMKQTSGWYNPLDPKRISSAFDEENTDSILTLPGQLGEMLGPLERGWLVTIIGAFKRGKTWYLQEMAVQALAAYLKVAFISLEMKGKSIDKRLYKRLTAFAEKDQSYFIYPVFDCALNQDGSCASNRRKNRITLIGEDGVVPDYHPNNKYRPCCECRKDNPQSYIPAVWYTHRTQRSFEYDNVNESVGNFVKMYGGNNLRVRTYPRFQATVSDIQRDLDILEHTEGFIPDVIITDYLGIIRPEGKKAKDFEALDIIWKEMAGMAEQRHCLAFTGSQVERSTLSKRTVEEDGLAGWIGQLGHVDISLALNQTKEEKRRGIMRFNLLGHRHKEFFADQCCVVLQQLELGQTLLDAQLTNDI